MIHYESSTFSDFIHLFQTAPALSLQYLQNKLGVNKDIAQTLISQLQQFGLPIVTNENNQIHLTEYINPLDINKIQNHLPDDICKQLDFLPIFLSTDSTNQYLKITKADFTKKIKICLAEHQTNGRGRQTKKWVSPIASNIYLSLHVSVKVPANKIGGMSLIAGISIIEALQKLGVTKAKIKWPNDIYLNDKKLAGILIESTKIEQDRVQLIIGMGINVNMPQQAAKDIDQPWIDLKTITSNNVCRNKIIASIIHQLMINIKRFEQDGFSAFMPQWLKLDYLVDKTIVVESMNSEKIIGTAMGVNEQGELLVNVNNTVFPIHAGEISVRKVLNDTVN